MSVVVTFAEIVPPPRFDDVPWEQVRIEEGATSAGAWTTIDTLTLDPLDNDPSDPQSRDFTTPNGTAPDLWYRLTFIDGAAGESLPTVPVQNRSEDSPYTTTDELFRVLKVRSPSGDQTVAAQRAIDTAAGEINAEIDLAPGSELEAWELQLCSGVNLDRAADLWRHTESIPGVLGALDESLALPVLRYSWERYAQRLAPVKDRWGIA
jgi:hypothetical protein